MHCWYANAHGGIRLVSTVVEMLNMSSFFVLVIRQSWIKDKTWWYRCQSYVLDSYHKWSFRYWNIQLSDMGESMQCFGKVLKRFECRYKWPLHWLPYVHWWQRFKYCSGSVLWCCFMTDDTFHGYSISTLLRIVHLWYHSKQFSKATSQNILLAWKNSCRVTQGKRSTLKAT